jgi:hypothetical protein
MRHLIGLSLLLVSFSVAVEARPLSDRALGRHLIGLEKQSWVAWQNMNAKFWDRFLSSDHIELNGFVGATGKKQVIDGIASGLCKVNSYKVDQFTFRRFDTNTAVLIYRAAQDTSCGAMKVPSPVWATSLYQLRDGRWQNVLYSHTPVMQPPPKKAP